jgi:predicted nuclease of predicted toxin-antitoxin system
MKILLDECLPRKLKRDLERHQVRTVPEMGWAGKSNGELLALAERRFDVFVTADQSLAFQQHLPFPGIAVVILVAGNNRLATLRPLLRRATAKLRRLKPGDLVQVEG